jgi:hypothetical protein
MYETYTTEDEQFETSAPGEAGKAPIDYGSDLDAELDVELDVEFDADLDADLDIDPELDGVPDSPDRCASAAWDEPCTGRFGQHHMAR